MIDAKDQDPAFPQRPRRWRQVIRGLDWLSLFFVGYMVIGGLIRSRLPDRAYSEDSWYGCRLTSGWFHISAHCPDTGLGRVVEFWVESTFTMGLFPFALLNGNMLSGHQPWYQIAPAVVFAVLQIALFLWLAVLLIRLPIRGVLWILRTLRA
ncbi:hypothetical protein [Nioella sp. MMSF_3534]|uniref:hypothetical protein n=1 Tax=Nioella sp. MMSF_3534 TaxID=3046720 RepID=UPI00273D9F9E|nr:hypothetical protein [Nioella sp. MMSF_3534]